MTSESHDQDNAKSEQPPANEDLEEPSTEKEPGNEPKSKDGGEPEPSHQAVGIGVIGGPLVDPEKPAEDD